MPNSLMTIDELIKMLKTFTKKQRTKPMSVELELEGDESITANYFSGVKIFRDKVHILFSQLPEK